MAEMGRVLLESYRPDTAGWGNRFAGQVGEVCATQPAEVLPALGRLEEAAARGLHGAGFICYEAAAGIDPSLATHPPAPGLPLLWFGLYRERQPLPPATLPPAGEEGSYTVSDWLPPLSPEAYAGAVGRIRELIAAGDTYQVNFTMASRFRFAGDPDAWYRDLCRAQLPPYGASVAWGPYRLLSASPELFFSLRDGLLTARPMKGTAPRGRWHGEDRLLAGQLAASAKERAENLMIVDLLRNDLGMVAESGSVRVEGLFAVESLPTLHQMTSTVTAQLKSGTGLADILTALFPCGSITGAPKRRSMEIIRDLEGAPRGPYTGCIGYISPGPEALFSIAIRTAVIDLAAGEGSLGVGSGITWDSRPAGEYAECLAKARFATAPCPDFQLVETMRFDEDAGYFLLERHLGRLGRAAAYFGFPVEPAVVRSRLQGLAGRLSGSQKVRLLLAADGRLTLAAEPLAPDPGDATFPVAIAATPVDSAEPLLYHKTTHRPVYLAELARRPDLGDVIFVNERGEVTEGANHNIAVRLDGRLLTPPLACGLLAGTFREELLESGILEERLLTPLELHRAEELFLINSVRGWRRARLV